MPDDAIERARDVEERTMICVNDIHALATQLATGSIMPAMFRRKTFARLLAFASQQAPGMALVPRDDLARIRTSMCMLQQNSEGCAANHYGGDHELFGMPGWLTDTRRDVDALSAMLDAAPSVTLGEVG